MHMQFSLAQPVCLLHGNLFAFGWVGAACQDLRFKLILKLSSRPLLLIIVQDFIEGN